MSTMKPAGAENSREKLSSQAVEELRMDNGSERRRESAEPRAPSAPRGKAPNRKPSAKNDKQANKDPVEVYCRLRPLNNPNEVQVIKILNNKVVQLDPLDNAAVKGPPKHYQYTFNHVFNADASQKDVFKHVALPLVSDLIRGKPGLLFTYGITSGKTYTMSGSPQDGGILPRSLDVIFNSIGEFQAHRYVFKPDKLNGFDTQTWAEAVLEHQRETLAQASKTPKAKRKDDGMVDWSSRACETEKVDVDPDMAYAVFVSYMEIYNNYVYDLLDDDPVDPIGQLQTRTLREDSKQCVYAFGVTEVEAKTANEAFDVYCRGQKRKRMAHTALNAESSRSHSIFNIRLVQATLDAGGSEIIPDKNFTISQLSLVDLAGTERKFRTGCSGNRLREAANINNSLMCLRTCIEILRENQTRESNKMVPYRDTKLTHLFKSFFYGEGKVKMVVCVNPCADDYETLHVMKFAEMVQEVLLPGSTPSTPLIALHSARRRKQGLLQTDRFGGSLKDFASEPLSQPLQNPVQEPMLPNYVLALPSDEELLPRMVEYLTHRISLRKSRDDVIQQKREELRRNIEMEEECNILKEQRKALCMDLKAREHQITTLEKQISNSDSAAHSANLGVEELRGQNKALEIQIREKDMLLNQRAMEKVHMRNEMEGCIALERQYTKRAMDRLLAEKQAELESKVCMTQEKFRLLKEILNTDNWDLLDRPIGNSSPDEVHLTRPEGCTRAQSRSSPGTSEMTMSTAAFEPRIYPNEDSKGIPVCNPHHQRSKSSGGELWVDHRPPGNVHMDTVMQPIIKKRKSVGKLDVNDVTKKASKYVLMHQEQDASGDIETQLYKGDVIPSIGGGAQVIFRDVETVTQVPPISTSLRKRSSGGTALQRDDIEAKCSVSTEGHPYPSVIKHSRV